MPEVKNTPAAAIFVAWLIVGVPAAWGIYNTALNARKLFAAPAAVSAPASTAASPAPHHPG